MRSNEPTKKQPTKQQIKSIKSILEKSIDQLIANDSDIFDMKIVPPSNMSPEENALNRKLHEITINHRLAFYLEINIRKTKLKAYKVDIEYNRFYDHLKNLQTEGELLTVRPDIIIHTRLDDEIEQQHYLVVEAKKGQITQGDIGKIKGFISDSNYFYLFGLTISYCLSSTLVLANLYYSNGIEIINEEINRPKRSSCSS